MLFFPTSFRVALSLNLLSFAGVELTEDRGHVVLVKHYRTLNQQQQQQQQTGGQYRHISTGSRLY